MKSRNEGHEILWGLDPERTLLQAHGEMRIVSTVCSNTEIVCALGGAELLVGVDDHSDFPAEVVEGLPRVGPDLTVDPERIRALEPDLVLASLTVPGHEKVIASLEAAGLPYRAFQPFTIEDVYQNILEIGELISRKEEAAALVAEMKEGLKAHAAPPRRPRLMVEWWPRPVIIPGKKSWVHQLIELAGGENPLGEEDCESRPLENADAAALDPDAIIISWCGVPFEKYREDVVFQRACFGQTPAVERGLVRKIPEAYLGRPGPRLVDGLRELRAIVEECARFEA